MQISLLDGGFAHLFPVLPTSYLRGSLPVMRAVGLILEVHARLDVLTKLSFRSYTSHSLLKPHREEENYPRLATTLLLLQVE